MQRKEKNKVVRFFRQNALELIKNLEKIELKRQQTGQTYEEEVRRLWQIFLCLIDEVKEEKIDKRKKVYTISSYVVDRFAKIDRKIVTG